MNNWQSKYHEGACCGGCIGEQELGYTGGGEYCCCYEGLTPLEQWDNPVKYPPVNGGVPEEFRYFKYPTKQRWFNRFEKELEPELAKRLKNTLAVERVKHYQNERYTREQVVDVVNAFMHWGTP